ncbi:response regulator [Oscillatoria sp. FACHB-1406]|nr:response regulator [Oscillatoria sp. FACHB-1406]
MPKVVRWRNSFYVQTVAVSEKFPWTVVVELASAPYLDVLDRLYTNSFATLMAIAILSPLIAKTISRNLVQPLRQLKNVTTNLPDKLLDRQKLDLPDSQIAEINALTDNYQLMAIALQNKFQEIQQANREIQHAKEIADSANQAKSEFLASMSHELRTPLNGILGYAQILSRSKVLPEKERHGANIIHECGAHLLTLINDVLDLSKIEARKLELSAQAIHLPSVLQGVVEICQIRADQKGLSFHYEPDANLPEGIEADEKRLRQVLINLLGNAIKFTDKGSVSLRVEQLASSERSVCLRFCISDTGTGIARENRDQLFQAFTQVGERTRQAEGTGLGLAISQQIVQLMGGEIRLESQLGVGSEFFFTLEMPLASDWGKQQTARASKIIGYKGSPRQILVVDDRWENRSVLVNLLEPLGFKAIEAENGQEALERMQQQLPDLVITDLSMPVMDGFEMLKQVRSEDALKSLKVIVSSASVSQRDRQKGLRGGGDYFLAKPIHAEELFQLLAESLHLDWVYEESSPKARSTSEPVEIVLPPREQLQQLLEFAQKGRLRQLIALAEQMSEQDDRYQPFAKQIVPMAKQFQIEQLEQLLQSYLAAENNL